MMQATPVSRRAPTIHTVQWISARSKYVLDTWSACFGAQVCMALPLFDLARAERRATKIKKKNHDHTHVSMSSHQTLTDSVTVDEEWRWRISHHFGPRRPAGESGQRDARCSPDRLWRRGPSPCPRSSSAPSPGRTITPGSPGGVIAVTSRPGALAARPRAGDSAPSRPGCRRPRSTPHRPPWTTSTTAPSRLPSSPRPRPPRRRRRRMRMGPPASP